MGSFPKFALFLWMETNDLAPHDIYLSKLAEVCKLYFRFDKVRFSEIN